MNEHFASLNLDRSIPSASPTNQGSCDSERMFGDAEQWLLCEGGLASKVSTLSLEGTEVNTKVYSSLCIPGAV